MIRRILKHLYLPGLLAMIGVLLLRGAQLRDASFSAMKLAASAVVPVLFPFSVLSSFLLRIGFLHDCNGRISNIFTRFFRIESCGFSAWLLGTLCGFPIGASVLAGMYESGAISRRTAERMAAWCTSASPAFVVLVAGQTILGNQRNGWLLLAIHTASSLCTACALRNRSIPSTSTTTVPVRMMPLEAFTGAVQTASLTMIHVCGYMVLFSAASILFSSFLSGAQNLNFLLRGLLELTSGLFALTELPLRIRFLASAVLLGWSGCCVHCQVLSLLLPYGLSPRPYITGKLLQTGFSLFLALPFFFILPEEAVPVSAIETVSGSAFVITTAWAMISMVLFFSILWKFRFMSAIIKKRTPEG